MIWRSTLPSPIIAPLRAPFHSAAGRRGSVLIVVLWVSLALVALAVTFGHSMLMAYHGADNDFAGHQAAEAIEGASRYVEALLVSNAATAPGAFPDFTTYQSEAVPIGEATVWLIGRDNNTDPTSTPVFGLVDEASKLNLNTATAAMLGGLPGMTPDIAASIYNWCHDAAAALPEGAQAESYLSQRPPYICKNDKFESTEELALVFDMDALLLFGEDANQNGALDPNEDDGEKNPPSDNSNGKLDAGIFEYVTCFTREPNTKSDGTPKVNVSNVTTISPDLDTLLKGLLQPDRVTAVEQRLSPSRLPNAPPPPPIRSALDFYTRSGMTEAEFALVEGSITVSTGQYASGLINVNTASQTVLSCIPGITPDLAQALVSARQGRLSTDTGLAWIINVLGAGIAQQAGPYLTGKSYQVGADIAAVGRNGRGYRRTRFVIDMSSGQPQIVYRRNLAHLGWALGKNARDSIFTGTNRPL